MKNTIFISNDSLFHKLAKPVQEEILKMPLSGTITVKNVGCIVTDQSVCTTTIVDLTKVVYI